MALNSYQILSQYWAVCYKKNNETIEYKKAVRMRNQILNNLNDINYKISSHDSLSKFTASHYLGWTPLHFAVQFANSKIDAENVIKQGADFTVKNKNGETSLHQALYRCLLQTDRSVYLSEIDWIQSARYSGDLSTILSAHVDYSISENPYDELGISHFHIACMTNHVKAVEYFLNNGVLINDAIKKDSKMLPGCSPLHLAIQFCALETVQILLKFGANINLKNIDGKTAVHLLIEHNIAIRKWIHMSKPKTHQRMELKIKTNEEILNLLLTKDYDHECSGLSLLQIACTMQNPSRVKQLLQEGVDLDHHVSLDSIVWPGYTALHFAAQLNINTVKLLLQSGANLLAKDANGVTPFDLCLERYNAADIHSLLSGQLNFNNIKFSDEKTKLCDFVFAMQDKSSFESFLQEIADLNIYIPLNSLLWPGFTPLHLTVIFHKENRTHDDFIEFLETLKMTDEDETENEEEDEDEEINNGEVSNDAEESHDEEESHDVDGRENYTDNKKKNNDENKGEAGNEVESKSEEDQDKDDASGTEANKLKKRNENQTKVNLDLYRIKLCLEKGANICIQDINGSSPLHLAFQLQHKNIINYLIKLHESNLNPIDIENLSHLHIAVAYGDKIMVKKLLDADKTSINLPVKSQFHVKLGDDDNVDFQSKRKIHAGSTPLHVAVLFENHEMAKLLLDFGANVYAEDIDGFTPVHRLIEIECDDTRIEFEDFLESIENLEDRVVQSTGLSHLHIAVMLNRGEVVVAVEKLLDRGADIESKITATEPLPFLRRFDKMRPLQLAVMYGYELTTWLLIEEGAKIIHPDATVGSSALYQAFSHSGYFLEGCREIILMDELPLDAALCQLIERETGITVLHLACYALNRGVAQTELGKGANVNARVHGDSPLWPGCSPLHVLTMRNTDPHGRVIEAAERALELLLKHDTDVTSMNEQHETPVHMAWRQLPEFHPRILDKLLNAQKDFNVNPVDSMGTSHFHLACARDCNQVVSQFLDHGVDLNCQIDYFAHQCEGGRSPLHLALIHGSEKSRDLLLARGADVRLADNLGNTPLHVAIQKYPTCFEIFEKIIRAGADVFAANVYGITPFEMLLQSEDTAREILDLIFAKDIHVNAFNPITDEGYLAIAFHAISMNEEEVKMKPAFEVMMGRYNLNVLDDMGRNAIHNLVSSKPQKIDGRHRGYNTIKNYTLVIDRLARIGCDVDQQDKQGRTPLHVATQMANREAIIALFHCGVDVNITDEDYKPALAYVFEYGIDRTVACPNLFDPYYFYLSSLYSFGFDLSKENCELYRKALHIFNWNPVTVFRDYEEIEKLKSWRIGSLPMKLFELLGNKGVVAYTMMDYKNRLVVDELFQSGHLRDEVPNTVSFLIRRYREAQTGLKARMALIEPALISLCYLVPCQLPDVCAHIILKYLSASELKNLIIASE